MKREPFVIKQWIPAPDWFAVYSGYYDDEPEKLTLLPLVGWAIVPGYYIEDEDGIVPMTYTDDGVDRADRESSYLGSVHASQRDDVKEWIRQPKSKVAAMPDPAPHR